MNFSQLLTISAILIGGSFQFGYQTGVINEPLQLISNFIANASDHRNLSFSSSTVDAITRIIVAAFPTGGLIGAMMAGWLADRFGRRMTMIVGMLPCIVASLLMMFSQLANSFEMMILGRFIIGISCGGFTALAPMYLSEIAPLHLRGALGTMNQLMIVIAILVSQFLGLDIALGTQTLWPFLLGFSIFPSVLALFAFPFCPESPRYLMLAKQDEPAARLALYNLRGTVDIETEIAEMRKELESIGDVQILSVPQAFRINYLRNAILIGIVMQLSQQLSGINSVINYSTSIFTQSADLSTREANFATIGVGGLNVIVTFVSVFLMDRAGRKTLHMLGLLLMAFWTLVITLALNLRHNFAPDSAGQKGMVYLTVASVFLYVGSFALGPGAIPWFIVAEMFTQSSRGAAMGVCVAVNWICQIAIAEGFPYLQDYLKDYSFLPFLILLILFALFTYWKVPETKGKTPEEMENLFKGRANISNAYQALNNSDVVMDEGDIEN